MKRTIEDLKHKIRPSVMDAKAAWRGRAISWLTSILRKLDRSYDANVRDALAPAPAASNGGSNGGATSLPSPVAGSGPVVVLDEGGVVQGARMLTFVLSAIFGTEKLSGVAAELFGRLSKTGLWSSQIAVGEEAYKIALAEAAAGTDTAPAWASALAAISIFLQNARSNAAVYKVSGKIHPDAVFWPDPSHPKRPRPFANETPVVASEKIVDRATPIGSAGSCFAMEIAHRLQERKFNYVVTEANPNVVNGLSDSCARWGTIFNVPAFRQLVEKSFGVIKLPRVVFTDPENGEMRYYDPFREGVFFRTVDEYEAEADRHLENAREALLRCRVFVLTLGMNEIWRMRSGGYVLSRTPWRFASGLCDREVLTVDQNLAELRRMTQLWRAHNPDIKFIVSVSPVPLHATFQGESSHVIVANCHAKSTLRVVAEEFARTEKGVYYFPSYESVMYCTDGAWDPDGRHVSRAAVDKVMSLFDQMFVKD